MASKIKARAKAKNGVVTVKCLMKHKMETGLRKDKKTGETIPAHFIKEVTGTVNDKKVFVANFNSSISKNPYLSFKYKGAKGDEVNLNWTDNKSGTGVGKTKVK